MRRHGGDIEVESVLGEGTTVTVTLPAIVTDLATWTRLREASWIINGYLLVYVVTMPVAGRLADALPADAYVAAAP